MVKKGNDKIKLYDDLKGKMVVVKVGIESVNFFEKNKEKYDYIIKNFDDVMGFYKVLENGEVDVIVDDYFVLGYVVKNG